MEQPVSQGDSKQPTQQDAQAARQCLVIADKFIKEKRFDDARQYVEKARSLDHRNPYIDALLERIIYFAQEAKKEGKPGPKAEIIQPEEEPVPHFPKLSPPPPEPEEEEKSETPIIKLNPDVPKAPKPEPPPPKKVAPPPPVFPKIPPPDPGEAKHNVLEKQITEMKNQIDALTKALEQERNTRQEISKQHLESGVMKLRQALIKVWEHGAPDAKDADECHTLAETLNIPPDVEKTVIREVKLEKYGKAVKEVITKKKLLKSSSSTLEWLRKVYKVSVEEYLEYESKFLTDLVSDSFKGTLLFVCSDQKLGADLTPKLKADGYAVVQFTSPENALEKIEKLNPNIILVTANNGSASLSGIKFLHIVRGNSKFNFLPFIIIYAKDDPSMIARSELRENEGLVTLPVDYSGLIDVLNQKLRYLKEYISSIV